VNPKPSGKQRKGTAIRFPSDIHERLQIEADARDVSINWLVNRAVADYLPRLIPVDEWKLTK
jgi:predicted transcriptional regulator